MCKHASMRRIFHANFCSCIRPKYNVMYVLLLMSDASFIHEQHVAHCRQLNRSFNTQSCLCSSIEPCVDTFNFNGHFKVRGCVVSSKRIIAAVWSCAAAAVLRRQVWSRASSSSTSGRCCVNSSPASVWRPASQRSSASRCSPRCATFSSVTPIYITRWIARVFSACMIILLQFYMIFWCSISC